MVFLENTAADCGVYSAKEKGKERNRKMRKTKEFIDGILPKEMPIDKKINYVSQADSFQRIKDSIQVSIDKMTRG